MSGERERERGERERERMEREKEREWMAVITPTTANKIMAQWKEEQKVTERQRGHGDWQGGGGGGGGGGVQEECFGLV